METEVEMNLIQVEPLPEVVFAVFGDAKTGKLDALVPCPMVGLFLASWPHGGCRVAELLVLDMQSGRLVRPSQQDRFLGLAGDGEDAERRYGVAAPKPVVPMFRPTKGRG